MSKNQNIVDGHKLKYMFIIISSKCLIIKTKINTVNELKLNIVDEQKLKNNFNHNIIIKFDDKKTKYC